LFDAACQRRALLHFGDRGGTATRVDFAWVVTAAVAIAGTQSLKTQVISISHDDHTAARIDGAGR
jgi:hypothetical protein